MRTSLIVVGGIVSYVVLLLVVRGFTAAPAAGALTAKIFIPLWFVAAACNMWVGVTQAGYSVGEELPIFLLIFAVPAALAVLTWWRYG